MSRFPYICDFRGILHVWDTDNHNKEKVWYGKPCVEVLHTEEWISDFLYLPKRMVQKRVTGKVICLSEDPHKFRQSNSEYAKECMDESGIYDYIVETYIKPKGEDYERYYEVMGKYHFHSYQNYEGEWDSDDEVSRVKWQELDDKTNYQY